MDEAYRNISVTEGETVSVCAHMLGMADFVIPASFRPYSVNDSAEGDVDFVTAEQQFHFPAHNVALQCVDVHTVDDDVVEREEEFEVELIIPEQDNMKIALGNSVVFVRIVDNDCEFECDKCAGHVTIM